MKKPLDYSEKSLIDLHIHSTFSDGSLHPAEILKLAEKLNIWALSITDHDSIAGVREILALKIPTNIRFITGVEISTAAPSFCYKGSMHILGYGIDVKNDPLNHALIRLQSHRKNRNPKILEKLKQFGIKITMDQLISMFPDQQLGRPHIAMLMLKMNHVNSVDEAFDRFLSFGKPAYVEKKRIECEDAIKLIRDAGGIPVLAHPYLLPEGCLKNFSYIIRQLKEIGIQGIEVYYPEHTAPQTDLYLRTSQDNSLYISGGTDFHGDAKKSIQMGIGFGNFNVPKNPCLPLINKTTIK